MEDLEAVCEWIEANHLRKIGHGLKPVGIERLNAANLAHSICTLKPQQHIRSRPKSGQSTEVHEIWVTR